MAAIFVHFAFRKHFCFQDVNENLIYFSWQICLEFVLQMLCCLFNGVDEICICRRTLLAVGGTFRLGHRVGIEEGWCFHWGQRGILCLGDALI